MRELCVIKSAISGAPRIPLVKPPRHRRPRARRCIRNPIRSIEKQTPSRLACQTPGGERFAGGANENAGSAVLAGFARRIWRAGASVASSPFGICVDRTKPPRQNLPQQNLPRFGFAVCRRPAHPQPHDPQNQTWGGLHVIRPRDRTRPPDRPAPGTRRIGTGRSGPGNAPGNPSGAACPSPAP